MSFLFGPRWGYIKARVCDLLPNKFCAGPYDLIETRYRWPQNNHGKYPVPYEDQINENGCSRRQVIHFGQIGRAKRFQQYDWGNETNHKKYATSKPPEIKVRDIKNVPIVLYVGEDDSFSTIEDSKWLQKEVKTIKKTHVLKDFNHDKM